MFRKRERFERSDVPHETPYSNVIGVVVCVVVFVALGVTVFNVWNRVNLESRLGSRDLGKTVSAQAKTTAPDGYQATDDEVETTLLLTVDSADSGSAGTQLTDARILALNKTQNTATLATIPVSCEVTSDETVTTLSDLCAASGTNACVTPLASACGVKFTHVVVATEDILERAAALVGSSKSELFSQASSLLSLMRTDMDPEELLAFAESVSGVGLGNIQRVEATLVADSSRVESGLQVIDKTSLCLSLGTIVAAS